VSDRAGGAGAGRGTVEAPPGAARVRLDWNRHRQAELAPGTIPPADPRALAFHRTLPGYRPTPLVALPCLAAALGLGQVWLKDEAPRFGLLAFKGLGASWAIHRFLETRGGGTTAPGRVTFATATDGNHGRAVAWTARLLGQHAVVFVPRNTVPARVEAIRREGARVVVVDGTYDEAVRRAAAESEASGWHVISDTAYPGYLEVPRWIMAGYETLFAEAAEALAARGHGDAPDAVLLQAGVGGFAAAGAAFLARRAAAAGRARPALVVVEPTDADGLRASIVAPGGEPRAGQGGQNSIMAGLNCGMPSLVAWPLLRATADAFLAVDDAYAEAAVRALAAGTGNDPPVAAGESGAAGLAGLLALCREPDLADARRRLRLDGRARVLLVSTEGPTDPESWRRIVGRPPPTS
jgi:diaminopropionate ammonia-lyase